MPFPRRTSRLLASLAALLAGGAAHAQTPRPAAEWALFLYMDADTDLEEPTLGNLEEILQVGGSTAKVRVVALVDRSPLDESGPPPEEDDANKEAKDDDAEADAGDSGYTNRAVANLKDWSGAKLLEPRDGELVQIADWGNVNMGDPATLRRFIETAGRLFPAKRHLLLFSDHGAGWQGVCFDDSADGDGLTIDEIAGALRATRSVVPVWDMIGHDACLMGAFEVVEPLAEFSRVQVVSEELVPGDGWNYVTTLRTLNRDPAMTGIDLGAKIADAFQDYFDKSNRSWSNEVTLSVIRSDALPAVARALGDLARSLKSGIEKDPEAWRSIAQARARTEFVSSRDSAMLDMVHLAHLIKKRHVNNRAIVAQCDALIAAAKAAVVHNVHGKDRPNANGLTILFPATSEAIDGDEDDPASIYANTAQARRLPWFPMLSAYAKAADDQPSKPLLGEVRASARSVTDGRNVTVSGSIDTDEAQEVFFTVATAAGKGDRRVLSSLAQDPDDAKLSEEWDGTVVALEGGGSIVPLAIVHVESAGDDEEKDADADAATSYKAEVLLRRGGRGPWRPLSLTFDTDADDEARRLGNFTSASVADDDNEQERPYRVGPGDEIRSVPLALDKEGKPVDPEDESGPRLRFKKGEKLRLIRTRVKPGTYAVGFRALNLADDAESQTVEVRVEAAQP